MAFSLTYRQGSFTRAEDHRSKGAALYRACELLAGPGCSDFAICTEDGGIVMTDDEIRDECRKAKAT